jgi:hypothetical protein
MPPRKPRSAAAPAKIFGRPRSTVIKAASLASAALVVIIAGITGIGPSDPSVTVSVKNFLLAWESGNYATAAAMTTGDQAVVARTLKDAYSQIGAADLTLGMATLIVAADTAIAHFDAASTWAGEAGPGRIAGTSLCVRAVPAGWSSGRQL